MGKPEPAEAVRVAGSSAEVHRIDGVRIKMYPGDHEPPHFHAVKAEDEMVVYLDASPPYRAWGDLPPADRRKVLDWALAHEADVLARWPQVQSQQYPDPIL